MSESRIRILIVDDHPVVRDGLAAMLSTQADFDIVGEAGDGLQALELAAQIQPELVLMDLEMPNLDGVETIHRLRETAPTVQVVVLTAFDTDERIIGAIEAGAQGYLLKGAPRREIFQAIRVVSQGGALIPPLLATKLFRQVRQTDRAEALTEREQDVLHLIAQGLSNAEIGQRLTITQRTVKFHVSSILAKLQAKNRTDAVRLAREHGLLSK